MGRDNGNGIGTWEVPDALGSQTLFRELKGVYWGGAQRTTHEAKQRDCLRLVHLRLYGHVGVFTDPLPGTGCVLGSRY